MPIEPSRTGNIGLFLGVGLQLLERECLMLRWCCTVCDSPGKGARLAVLYNIKCIIKWTFPFVHIAYWSSALNQLLAGEWNSDVDSVIIHCSFEHLRNGS